eukprot:m.45218 g.45218  ORF g.45218 m.45218 type:complete len:286 (+) comp12421_c0_seq1:184-1041(+)
MKSKRTGFLQATFRRVTESTDDEPQTGTWIVPVGHSERGAEAVICYVEAIRHKEQATLRFFDHDGSRRGKARVEVRLNRASVVRSRELGDLSFEAERLETDVENYSVTAPGAKISLRASSPHERNQWADFIEGRDEFFMVSGVFILCAALTGAVCLVLELRSNRRLASALQERDLARRHDIETESDTLRDVAFGAALLAMSCDVCVFLTLVTLHRISYVPLVASTALRGLVALVLAGLFAAAAATMGACTDSEACDSTAMSLVTAATCLNVLWTWAEGNRVFFGV